VHLFGFIIKKCFNLDGFLIKKFVTMYGHMNVKKKKIFLTNVNDDLQIILKKVSEQDYFEAVS